MTLNLRTQEHWEQIDLLLEEVKYWNPYRVARIKKDLQWLRKHGEKKGIPI